MLTHGFSRNSPTAGKKRYSPLEQHTGNQHWFNKNIVSQFYGLGKIIDKAQKLKEINHSHQQRQQLLSYLELFSDQFLRIPLISQEIRDSFYEDIQQGKESNKEGIYNQRFQRNLSMLLSLVRCKSCNATLSVIGKYKHLLRFILEFQSFQSRGYEIYFDIIQEFYRFQQNTKIKALSAQSKKLSIIPLRIIIAKTVSQLDSDVKFKGRTELQLCSVVNYLVLIKLHSYQSIQIVKELISFAIKNDHSRSIFEFMKKIIEAKQIYNHCDKASFEYLHNFLTEYDNCYKPRKDGSNRNQQDQRNQYQKISKQCSLSSTLTPQHSRIISSAKTEGFHPANAKQNQQSDKSQDKNKQKLHQSDNHTHSDTIGNVNNNCRQNQINRFQAQFRECLSYLARKSENKQKNDHCINVITTTEIYRIKKLSNWRDFVINILELSFVHKPLQNVALQFGLYALPIDEFISKLKPQFSKLRKQQKQAYCQYLKSKVSRYQYFIINLSN